MIDGAILSSPAYRLCSDTILHLLICLRSGVDEPPPSEIGQLLEEIIEIKRDEEQRKLHGAEIAGVAKATKLQAAKDIRQAAMQGMGKSICAQPRSSTKYVLPISRQHIPSWIRAGIEVMK